MPETNKTITNTVGGEISPLMYGRIDLNIFSKSLAKCENFLVLPQGGARFRNGSVYVHNTRLNKKARFIEFQFSDQQAYLVEATDRFFRFYKDNAVITETAKTITGVTTASPGVFTSASHGFSNGDEVFIDSIGGITRLNGRFFLIANKNANDFQLTDLFGNAINTTGLGTYTSGGTAARIYEIATPYYEINIEELQFTQNADTMYISHQNYEPRKLTRSGHASWALATYTRTADPFTPATATISAATQANPGVITAAAHGFSTGDIIFISGVVGMTQLNGNTYIVQKIDANSFSLTTLAGVAVDTTGFTAYGSAGTATLAKEWPRATTFTDTARLMFGGTRLNPETIWGSKAPSTGVTAYDDFTTGSNATDAVIFTLAPIHGKVDSIQWLSSTSKFIMLGTFSALRRMYGPTEEEAISPTSINAKSVEAFGSIARLPISNGNTLFYIQRDSKFIRSMEYDFTSNGYITIDRNLVSEHLNESGYKQLTQQKGLPDLIWVTRNDGRLLGLTFKEKEDISGWHRHYFGGQHVNDDGVTVNYARVLWAGFMTRATAYDQLWLVVERKIGSNTIRTVEYIADQPDYPRRNEFYTDAESEDDDDMAYRNVLYEVQKDAVHLDMSVKFDGADAGLDANATMTPGATTGTGVTFTASTAVFTSAMVGRQIWKSYDRLGNGGGRAEIVTFTDSTHVVCDIIKDFDNTTAIAAGDWYLTSDTISGLDHLEGQTISVCIDGGPDVDADVANGAITISAQASKVIAGYKYKGVIESLNIDTGGVSGSAQAKNRNIASASIRFLNTLGTSFGTDIYKVERLVFRSTADLMDRPTPPFSGIKDQTYLDRWEELGKKVIILQDNPLPCTVLSLDLFTETTDE